MHRIEGVYLFPAPISVDGTVFGTTYHVTIGGVDATLSLPRRRPEWATQSGLAGDLLPPVARLPALARDYDKTVEWAWDISRWGGVMQWPDGYGYVTSGLLAVEFSTAGDPADAGRVRPLRERPRRQPVCDRPRVQFRSDLLPHQFVIHRGPPFAVNRCPRVPPRAAER
jgi:hypothetical protein